MSWLARLSETYIKASQLDIPKEEMPTPVCHTVQNAHINIVVDGDGNFRRAQLFSDAKRIVLPATEASSGRTSTKVAPHPLADKLTYVAGDYVDYGDSNKNMNRFESYRDKLKEWCDECGHHSVRAVLTYINRKSVISDLRQQKILWFDDNGVPLSTWPADKGTAPKLFKEFSGDRIGSLVVCWSVERLGDPNSDTWLDASLQKAWIEYETGNSVEKALCYATGEMQPIRLNHPKYIRHAGDKAKLISSNDSNGFTFRGRFTDDKGRQAATIGSIASQQAHAALRWLIKRQGYDNDNQVVVAWATSGREIPDPFLREPLDFDDYSSASDQPSSAFDSNELDHSVDLGQSYSRQLKKYMIGYGNALDANDTISIMIIDSATPGRMGVVYYRECLPSEYLDLIGRWYRDFSWVKPQYKNQGSGTRKVSPCSVTPKNVLDVACGAVKKSYGRHFFERLMPCIVEGRPIPYDLVQLAVRRASSPASHDRSHRWDDEWETSLWVACALYRGFFIRHPNSSKRKEFTMTLEKTNRSRDYLYGRLLAIAEQIEGRALFIRGSGRSTTTVDRLMQRFADRPYSTWLNIRKQLNPYILQLRTSRAGFMTNMSKEMDDVMSLFDPDEYKTDTALSGEFLLGFHLERMDLRKNDSDNEETS